MAKPLLYISYGMAKSGSTLAFQLVTAVLEEAGIAQADVDLTPTLPEEQPRFVRVFRPRELGAAAALAQSRTATPVAIKTHGGLWNCVAEGLDQGWIIGHAVCRDPRDIALSMMDASRAGLPWGKRNGQPLRHIDDALAFIREHAKKFETWARHPSILPINYERLAFETEAVAEKIAAQIGVEVDAKRCAKMAKASATNLNRGLSRRWESEMTAKNAEAIREEFAGFIDAWCDPGFAAPKRGLLSRIIGG